MTGDDRKDDEMLQKVMTMSSGSLKLEEVSSHEFKLKQSGQTTKTTWMAGIDPEKSDHSEPPVQMGNAERDDNGNLPSFDSSRAKLESSI